MGVTAPLGECVFCMCLLAPLFLAQRLRVWLMATVKQTAVKSVIRLLSYFTSLNSNGSDFLYKQDL